MLFMVALAVIALQGCGGTGNSSGSTGIAQVSLTDAPAAEFSNVWITVKDIWFHTSNAAGPNDPGWLKYPLSAPVTLDVLALSNGNMHSLWHNIHLPIGNYQQIRLLLVPTFTANPPSGHQYFNEVVEGSSTYPLHIPDAAHGISLIGAFSVTTGGTLRLAIDFDAGEDIVEFHEGSDFVLKPRLAYFDLDNAGAIGNSVTGSIVLTDSKMNNKMDSGLLFAVHGGMIVDAINIGTTPLGSLTPGGQIGAGGSYTITNLPGGSPGSPLAGAFYGIDAVGWSSVNSTYKSIAIPQIVDLRTGNDGATMDMLPLW